LTAKTSRLFLENVLLTVARNACQIFAVGRGVHLEFENVMISVLVIDDHPIVLRGCRRLLEDAGVTSVLEAGDVAAGYELFCCHRPDVVIMDLAMGKNGVEGLSLIQRIKSHDPLAHILVLSMCTEIQL
jgi:CheY-like chemotaxis protein